MACQLARIHGGAAWYETQLKEGRLQALSADRDGVPVLFVLWRMEATAGGLEFVIVAAAGESKDVDLMDTVLPALEDLARKAYAKSVRFHTSRAGLVRRSGRHGYHTAEIVMRKAL